MTNQIQDAIKAYETKAFEQLTIDYLVSQVADYAEANQLEHAHVIDTIDNKTFYVYVVKCDSTWFVADTEITVQ